MKITELRIGNHIFDRRKNIVILTTVLLCKLKLWNKTKYSKKPPCSAIPLTEERLLKVGFENDIVCIGYENPFGHPKLEGFFISNNKLYSIGYTDNHSYIANVEYVHKLQNLYIALKDEEIDISDMI